jgi:hypothetical protein
LSETHHNDYIVKLISLIFRYTKTPITPDAYFTDRDFEEEYDDLFAKAKGVIVPDFSIDKT